MHNKAEKVCFFEETFLLADISIDVTLKMLFLILSNENIHFTRQSLYWRSYTPAKALPITCHVKLID